MNEILNTNILEWVNPDMIVRVLVIYFFVVWFCLVVWVVRDITNRTKSIIFQIISILLVLFFTPLGIFIYLLLRPQKTIFEQVFEDEFFRLDSEFQKENSKNKPHRRSSPGIDIEHKKTER